jgi:hypothetical protein
MFLMVSSQHEELEQKDNRLEPEDEGLDPNILVVHCRSFAFQNSEQSLARVRHLRFSRILMPLLPNALRRERKVDMLRPARCTAPRSLASLAGQPEGHSRGTSERGLNCALAQ